MSEAEAPLCLPPLPVHNPDRLMLPAGSIDCHFHVFAPDAPLASPRSYTPQPQGLDGWLALARTFGIGAGVLVQPSVYGVDNSVLLSGLASESGRLRGVVVVPPQTTDTEFERLHRAGVRGVRINLRNKAGIGLAAAELLAPRLRGLGWHLQFQVGPDAIDAVTDLCARHAIEGVIDHLAFMPLDTPGPALAALASALAGGQVWVKLSAPYRLVDAADHRGYLEVVRTLTARRPDRLLWGSDWPHTELFSSMPEDSALIHLSLEAVPKDLHHQVFVTNPRTLYWSS